jgi:hypothetical protein
LQIARSLRMKFTEPDGSNVSAPVAHSTAHESET